jgi:CheY-like chemotaxis protein
MVEKLKRILYVEDDMDVAEVALMTLEDLGGFEVKHCASGEEAIAALPAYNPQLVLLDVMMPNMDGPETLKAIQAMPEGKSVPIVFMTAKAQAHQQEAYLHMGAVGVLSKPFDPATLSDSLRTLWQKNTIEVGHDDAASDHNSRIKAVQQRFIDRLKEQSSKFEATLQHVQNDALKDGELEALRMEVHKFAGAAQTFGFPSISICSAKLETYLDKIIEGGMTVAASEELSKILTTLIQDMNSSVSSHEDAA